MDKNIILDKHNKEINDGIIDLLRSVTPVYKKIDTLIESINTYRSILRNCGNDITHEEYDKKMFELDQLSHALVKYSASLADILNIDIYNK